MERRDFLKQAGLAAAAFAGASGTAAATQTPPKEARKGLINQTAFLRGSYPVGVQTVSWTDTKRNRTLPVEIYYPATSSYKGQDLDLLKQDQYTIDGDFSGQGKKRQAAVRDANAANGDFPVVIYTHGFAGNRREFNYFCTYLASHGYRVVSADHIGSTFPQVQKWIDTKTFNLKEIIPVVAVDRYGDIPFMLDKAEEHFKIEITAAGCTGLSLGGWTALCAPALDKRITAISPHCPGGVDGPLGAGEANLLGKYIKYDWKSAAKMLLIVGDRDSWLPLYGQLEVFAKAPGKDNVLAVMERADHQHFTGDMESSHNWFIAFNKTLVDADLSKSGPRWGAIYPLIQPFSTLMPEAEAQTILTGFVTQHFDAYLKGINRSRAANIESLRKQARQRDLAVYFIGSLA